MSDGHPASTDHQSQRSRDPLQAFRDEWPGWRIWRSDCGRWWATRYGRPTDVELRTPRWERTVGDVKTREELADLLVEQRALGV